MRSRKILSTLRIADARKILFLLFVCSCRFCCGFLFLHDRVINFFKIGASNINIMSCKRRCLFQCSAPDIKQIGHRPYQVTTTLASRDCYGHKWCFTGMFKVLLYGFSNIILRFLIYLQHFFLRFANVIRRMRKKA